MAKTKQEGYYKLESADKWLHFSMNCWVNLKQDSGKDIGTIFANYDKEDTIGQFIILSDIVYAAMKAYDQEESNEIDYDVFKVRSWMENLEEDTANGLVEAMTHSLNKPLGNKKAKK